MQILRLQNRKHGARLAAGLLALAGVASIAATVASGAVQRRLEYACPPGGQPSISGVSATAQSQSVSIKATVNPNGSPTVLSYRTTGTLITNLAGDPGSVGHNNDVVFTGDAQGRGANTMIEYVDTKKAYWPLTFVVTELPTIQIELETDGGGNILTTANDIVAAVNGFPFTAGMVDAALAPGNDGTGLVTAMPQTNLTVHSGLGVGIAADAPQTVTLELAGLTPNIPYLVVLEATNECPSTTPNTALTTIAVSTRSEAGVRIAGVWSAVPSDPASTISGTVVTGADPAGTGAGPSDTPITCTGSLGYDVSMALLTPIEITSCPTPFVTSASVRLVASAGPNSYFMGWAGTDCAPWGLNPVCYTNVVGKLDDTALFTNRPQLAVAFAGNGEGTVTSSPAGINCTATTLNCQAGFTPGATVTLTATPASGSAIATWGGDAIECGIAPTCALVMTEDKSVSIAFDGKPTLYVFRGGTGSGSVTSTTKEINCSAIATLCSATYNFGTPVTLTATPSPGSTFAGWGTDYASCAGTSPTCTLTARWSETITALFSAGHTLAITPEGNGTGVVTSSPSAISCPPTCAAVFPQGSAVTLSTTAAGGSTFDGWDDGPCFDRDTAAPCTVTLTEDVDIPVLFTNPNVAALKMTSNKGCTVVGSPRNDVLVGTSGNDVLCGGGGNDTLVGNGGNDVLLGAGGNDKLICSGACRMYGGAGTDTLVARGGGFSQLFGQAGNDTLLARNNARNVVDGGLGKNRARFDRGMDVLRKINRTF
jgi:hypothetical protein